MRDLEITWPDGIARFSPDDSPVQVGRSSSAAVPLTEGSVSRRHLEITWNGSSWSASDSSTHGTFDGSGVRLGPSWAISDKTAVHLGGVKGVIIELRPVTDADPVDNGNGLMADANGSSGDFGTNGNADFGGSDFGASAGSDFDASAGSDFDGNAGSDFGASAGSDFGGGTDFAGSGPSLFDEPRDPVGTGRPPPQADSAPPLFAKQPAPRSPDPILPNPLMPDPVLSESDFGAAAPENRRSSILDEAPSGATAPPAPMQAPDSAPAFDPPSPKPPEQAFDGDHADDDHILPGATGGYPAVRLGPNSTVISDSAIRLSIDGQDYSFLPGAEISVGRDPNCLVQVDEKHSLVSRRHLELTFDNGHWWIEDVSSKGTFIDNKRLTTPYKAEGAFIANLGDDDAGTPMKVITSGEHRTPRQLNLLAVAALASIALIPLILLGFLLSRNGSPSSEPDFVTAKQATVMLFGLDGGQGSGFFVDDNLIVTNQHVAVLSPQMLVGVSRQTDEPAEIEYATELVANHPYLDIAVLRVSNKATMTNAGPQISSGPVGNINLPSVTIGDSNDITIGDPVFSTGFPDRLSITSQDDAGELRLPPVAATSGEAASFTIWPGCSNPDFGAFIPVSSPPGVACAEDGDVNKGVLRSTFSSGQGASGSAVFRNNEVVAVVYAGDADDLNTSLNIATAAFSPWLQEIIDANP